MDADIDALYDLPPGEFTAARDALAKQLRADKRRDDAKAVTSLRRPSVAAWAVNQLARRHSAALDEVIAAGQQLASAQRRALSGIKDAGLQPAAAARRAAIEQAWSLAAQLLEEAGAGAGAQRQAVVDTLEAASADGDMAAAVREGRLTKELSAPSDFGSVSGFALVPAPDDAAADAEDADPDGDGEAEQAAAEEQRRRAAQEAATLARGRADEAQRRAGDARQAAVRATAEAQRLREQAEKAQQRAADAEQKASESEAEADELEAAATQARQEADRLEQAAG